MNLILNKKGTILVASYLVLFFILAVTSAFFMVVINDTKSVVRDSESTKAMNFAEKGIAYVYYESYNLGWQWYTHKWNSTKDTLLPLDSGDASYHEKLRTDCYFDSNGFYVHNNGEFMIKAYPDLVRENDTIVVSMGICGKEKKVLLYYLSRKGGYDFFYYTPYNLDLYSAVGHTTSLNGGGIHANGDIYLRSYMRLEDISEMSTGQNGKIYYYGDRYPAPYYADDYDGVRDGKSPIARLDSLTNMWRDDSIGDPGPYGYYDAKGGWHWKSYAYSFARNYVSHWPTYTYAFTNTERHFAGDSRAAYDVAPGAKDPDSSIINDSGEPLNRYNVWIKPYLQDEEGNKIDNVTWRQIPAELDQIYNWNKYKGDAYGTGSASNEKPITFQTKDDQGTMVDVETTWWEIDAGNDVVMLNPPADAALREAFFNNHPNAKGYWDMFKSPEYWQAVRGSSAYAGHLNPELIADGIYGSDRASGGKLPVKNTNSKRQEAAWGSYLSKYGLDNILRDANTGGENLDPPDFSTTYTRLAKKDGYYIGLVNEDYENDPDWQTKVSHNEWLNALEESVDAAVKKISDAASDTAVARKVEFINTFTGKWNVVLEIDLDKMQSRGVYPRNGVVYSKASKLPQFKSGSGFTVLGEENIYLKGDYNSDVEGWTTSAVISKKRIFTLSDNFNDPQVLPATEHYRDYPYLYVKEFTIEFPLGGSFQYYWETDPTKGDGFWVYRDYLDSDGAVDDVDYYSEIPDSRESTLRWWIGYKDGKYREIFNKDDPTGTDKEKFSWSYSGENYEYGMMPNKVLQNHTYNCLISSYRWLNSYQSNRGDILENWSYYDGGTKKNRYKNLNGAYFITQSKSDGGYTASNSEHVDYRGESGLYYGGGRGRLAPYNAQHYSRFLYTYYCPQTITYDERFKTATRAASDVFFGGAESLWAESDVDFFNKMSSF